MEESPLHTDSVTIQVPLRRRAERRDADRFAAAMPMKVDGREGTTRDLSSSGLSFVAERSYEVGARIEVVIEYILDGHHYPLRCQAEVIRVEPSGSAFTIGARLLPQTQAQDVPDDVARTLRRVG